MNKYQVISRKPEPRPTRWDKNNCDTYKGLAECATGIQKVGILSVKSVSIRSDMKPQWKRLRGPQMLRLWKEVEQERPM